jgi:hypothetical protein
VQRGRGDISCRGMNLPARQTNKGTARHGRPPKKQEQSSKNNKQQARKWSVP